MLSQDERRRLTLLERQLRRDDPAFAARMSGEPPRRRAPVALVLAAALIWAVGVTLAAAGWWAAAVLVGVWAMVISCALVYRCRPFLRAPGPLLPPA
jgi:fatty acid desaturase